MVRFRLRISPLCRFTGSRIRIRSGIIRRVLSCLVFHREGRLRKHLLILCGPNKDYYTVAVGMYQMLEREYIDQWFCSFASAAVIISIPVASLFLATQKYYSIGFSGSVKG